LLFLIFGKLLVGEVSVFDDLRSNRVLALFEKLMCIRLFYMETTVEMYAVD